MKRKEITYEGTPSQLRADVAQTAIPGKWTWLSSGQLQYRCADGVYLHWSPAAETLVVKGPKFPARYLEQRLFEVCSAQGVTGTTYAGDLWSFMGEVHATGIPGAWQMITEDIWRYRTSDGAKLTWYSTSGKLRFKGPAGATRRLEQALFRVLRALDRA